MYRLLSSIVPLTCILHTSVYAHQFVANGGNQIPFWAHTESVIGEIDLSTYDFGGIGTYAGVPYENCFVENDTSEGFDIAILGAPFDTVCIAIGLLILH
jgi:agmatinase